MSVFNKVLAVIGLVSSMSLASTASANPSKFAGDWLGKGTYILRGDLYQCSVVKFGFSATDTGFVFEYGGRECDKHKESFGRVEMTYKDGGLYYFGTKVGEYTDDKIEVSFSMPDDKGDMRHWRMSMRAEGNNLMYEERRILNDETTPMISFAGLMIKQ